MNLGEGVLAGYILLMNANILLESYIKGKVNKKIDSFLDSLDCRLDYREELIMEAITNNLLEELQPNLMDKLIPVIGLFKNVQALYYLEQDLEAHIYYLKQCYGDILFKEHSLDNTVDKAQEYFVSYELMGKYITICFTYLGGFLVITNGSETFKKLSLKEQYQTLYNILKELKTDRNKYNHSLGLEPLIEDLGSNFEIEEEGPELILKRRKEG